MAVRTEKVPTEVDAPLHSSSEGPAPSGVTQSPPGPAVVVTWEDDLKLMTLVAAGNTEAMNSVARRLSPRVRRLTRVIVRNDALADDAAQVALVEILQSARTYGGRSSLERWADRITARVTLRHARDERRRFEVIDSLDEPERSVDTPFVEADPADAARAQTPRALEEYLKAIPEAQREALILKHSLGHTVEEIADITGVPVGTVKDRLVTARRQVRRLIQRDLTLGQNQAQKTRRTP